MATKINNEVQYGIALWWVEEFEQALASLMEFRLDSSIDPKLAERLLAFQKERAGLLKAEIGALRAAIKEYESRASTISSRK